MYGYVCVCVCVCVCTCPCVLSLPRDLLEQCFSNFNVDTNRLGVLLKFRSWFGMSVVKPKNLRCCASDGFPRDADAAVCGPHFKEQGPKEADLGWYHKVMNASKVHRLVRKSFPFLLCHDHLNVLKVSPSLMAPGASTHRTTGPLPSSYS